jgi:acetylglutamate kinase
VLVEALPSIRKGAGKRVVVKVGGEVVDDPERLDSLVSDLVLMRFVGMCPVLIHGAGSQISQAMRRSGKKPSFLHGQRVTDRETIRIVKNVLGNVNQALVEAVVRLGGNGAGVWGDQGVLGARRARGAGGEDLGFVGEVERVNHLVLEALIGQEVIPVLAPLGTGPGGAYNINADVAAAAVAAALGAQKLVLLTNVSGLYQDLGDRDSLISQTDVGQLERLLGEGCLSEGMIPKISSVIEALKAGVPQAHILDGRLRHALLLEVFTDAGIGTMVLP